MAFTSQGGTAWPMLVRGFQANTVQLDGFLDVRRTLFESIGILGEKVLEACGGGGWWWWCLS